MFRLFENDTRELHAREASYSIALERPAAFFEKPGFRRGRLVAFILRTQPLWLGRIVAYIIEPFWFCLVLVIAIFRAVGIVARHLMILLVKCGDVLTDLIFACRK
jgi:hypothetical protein